MLMMKRQSFTSDFKEQALAKVFGRADDQGIDEVAAGLHMSSGTLKGWMKMATHEQKAGSRKAVKAKDFTLAEKLLALHETHGMSEEALNGWCRQRGVFARDLAQWRQAFTAGTRAGSREESRELRELRQAYTQLQRELNRKDRALAEAAALLVIQKKVRALWEAEDV
jgi:transposase-like protein